MDIYQPSPGRVALNADAGKDVGALPGFAYNTSASKSAPSDGIKGNFTKTPLNQAYFSPANFQIVQNAIRYKVFQESGETIDPVGADDLFMAMRAIFLQYSRNLPDNIPGQIEELNARVRDWCVPKILAEVSMYKTYMKDISSLPVPLSHPVNQSSAGTRSKPMPNFF